MRICKYTSLHGRARSPLAGLVLVTYVLPRIVHLVLVTYVLPPIVHTLPYRDVTWRDVPHQANLEVYLTRLVVAQGGGGENQGAAFTTGPLVPLEPGDEAAQVMHSL